MPGPRNESNTPSKAQIRGVTLINDYMLCFGGSRELLKPPKLAERLLVPLATKMLIMANLFAMLHADHHNSLQVHIRFIPSSGAIITNNLKTKCYNQKIVFQLKFLSYLLKDISPFILKIRFFYIPYCYV